MGVWVNHVEGELNKAASKAKDEKSAERKRHHRLLQLLEVPIQQQYRSLRVAKGLPPMPKKGG